MIATPWSGVGGSNHNNNSSGGGNISSGINDCDDDSGNINSDIFWNKINRIDRTVFRFHNDNWICRIHRSHILDTYGQFEWKRELNCYQGQSLPDAIYHNNSLEIIHRSTGLRIRFCAIEALRSWSSLTNIIKPIKTMDAIHNQHWIANQQISHYSTNEYDYTYTTLYRGGTDIIVLNDDDDVTNNTEYPITDYDDEPNMQHMKANSNSFVSRKVIDDEPIIENNNNSNTRVRGGGGARLRKPICKCVSDGGRAPLLQKKKKNGRQNNGSRSSTGDSSNSNVGASFDNTATPTKWEKTRDRFVNVEAMIRKYPEPLCFETVELYEDEIHENGICFLKAKIFVTPEGWAVLLRFFARIDGVMARVIDTRYTHHYTDPYILREISWREGNWIELVGHNNNNINNDSNNNVHHQQHHNGRNINDSVAARVLKLKYPVVTESLSLLRYHHSPFPFPSPHLFPPSPLRTTAAPRTSFPISNGNTNTNVPPVGSSNRQWNHNRSSLSSSREKEPRQHHTTNGVRQQEERTIQCFGVNNPSIQSFCAAPSSVAAVFGISLVIISGEGTLVEAIPTINVDSSNNKNSNNRAAYPVKPLWTKSFPNIIKDEEGEVKDNNDNNTNNSNSSSSPALTPSTTGGSFLSICISSTPDDGGRIVLGDDRGCANIWRLSTGESLGRFPVANEAVMARCAKNNIVHSSRLWVDRVVCSENGTFFGAAAGRSAVLVSTTTTNDNATTTIKEEATLESTTGTVTGIVFDPSNNNLAVASYGEVQWLVPSQSQSTKTSAAAKDNSNSKEDDIVSGDNDDNNIHKIDSKSNPSTLTRPESAVQCIDISPDGTKVAVGFLDKVVRVFSLAASTNSGGGCSDSPAGTRVAGGFLDKVVKRVFAMASSTNNGGGGCSDNSKSSTDAKKTICGAVAATDWVGFNTAVHEVKFSNNGSWLAALGGSAILVVGHDDLCSSSSSNIRIGGGKPPILCRTHGQTEADGRDGTCEKFASVAWVPSSSSSSLSSSTKGKKDDSLLIAVGKTKIDEVYLFDVYHNTNQAWPNLAYPVRIIKFPSVAPVAGGKYNAALMKVAILAAVGGGDRKKDDDNNNNSRVESEKKSESSLLSSLSLNHDKHNNGSPSSPPPTSHENTNSTIIQYFTLATENENETLGKQDENKSNYSVSLVQ